MSIAGRNFFSKFSPVRLSPPVSLADLAFSELVPSSRANDPITCPQGNSEQIYCEYGVALFDLRN